MSMRTFQKCIVYINCILILKCSPIFSNSLKNIWLDFENLNNYLVETLQLKLIYDTLQKNLLKKYFVILALYFLEITTRHLLVGLHFTYSTFFTYTLVAITFVILLHVLFYIESLHFIMKTINDFLSKREKKTDAMHITTLIDNCKSKAREYKIEVLKNIHYKLWKISRAINHNFGWVYT